MRVAILGAGAWGTALATLAAARHEVNLYARNARFAEELNQRRENLSYLPGIELPASVRCLNDLRLAVRGADLVLLATPVAGLHATCSELRRMPVPDLVWLCKGFEEHTGLLPHALVEALLPESRGAVLSGPSFAREVAQHQPTALTVASKHPDLQQRVVELFHAGALRVYKSDDVVGVEVGGAVKNVMAIATGVSDGLELGLNARAALVTRGLSEMMRFGQALGARAETLMGLTGVGDLILTCTGALSRNRQVGLALGRGERLPDILGRLGHVAEGVRCAQSVRLLAQQHDVEMPITDAVCAILFDGLLARDAVVSLLGRSPRSEI